MKRMVTLLLAILIYVLSVSFGNSVDTSFSSSAKMKGQDVKLQPGQEEAGDKEAEGDFKDEPEAKDEKATGEEKEAGAGSTTGTESDRLVLKGDFVYNPKDGKYYISSRQKLWISSKDQPQGAAVGVQKIEVKIDNGEYHEYYGSKTGYFSLEKEGPHTIIFRATDRLGNVEEPKMVQLVVDNTGPWVEVEYQVQKPKKYCVKSNVIYVPADHKILARAFDLGSGVQDEKSDQGGKIFISENGEEYKEKKSGDSITLSKPGWNVVRVKASDNVKNESAEYIVNVFVDNVSPMAEVIPQYDLIAAVADTDADKGEEDIAGEGGESTGGGTKSETGTKTETTTKTDTKKEDTTKPAEKTDEGAEGTPAEGTGEEDPIENLKGKSRGLLPGQESGEKKYSGVDNTFSVKAWDKESGIERVEIRLDEKGEWEIYKQPIRFYTRGTHVIEVRTTDCVGNVSTEFLFRGKKVSKVEIIVDTVPPDSKANVGQRRSLQGGGKPSEGGAETTKDDKTTGDGVKPERE